MANSDFEFSNLYITFPNDSEAKKLAKQLIEQRLANFVNIIPSMVTAYREAENSNIQVDSEALVMAKIRTKDTNSIIEFVNKNHPYDIAEIYSVPILHLSNHLKENLKTCLKSD